MSRDAHVEFRSVDLPPKGYNIAQAAQYPILKLRIHISPNFIFHPDSSLSERAGTNIPHYNTNGAYASACPRKTPKSPTCSRMGKVGDSSRLRNNRFVGSEKRFRPPSPARPPHNALLSMFSLYEKYSFSTRRSRDIQF